MIKLTNKKIVDLLSQKEELVFEGREISKQMEEIEAKIAELDKQERVITDDIKPDDLIQSGEKLKAEINHQIEELKKIGTAIEDIKLKAIPEEMVKEHYALRDEREKLENDRNKIGLKIQKIKDKVIPMIKKEVIPHLKEYDDIESSEILNGEVIIKTFNRLEEFKNSFKKKA